MKTILLLFAVVSLAASAPPSDYGRAKIVRYENSPSVNENDGYKFAYETSDGQSRMEEGSFVGADKILEVHGFYAYTDPKGNVNEVTYQSGENGFRAKTSYKTGLSPAAIASLVG